MAKSDGISLLRGVTKAVALGPSRLLALMGAAAVFQGAPWRGLPGKGTEGCMPLVNSQKGTEPLTPTAHKEASPAGTM